MKKGFSLIELIIAMSIMSIIAAVVVISLSNFSSLKLTNSAKAVVTSLREAQEEAITTQFRHGVRFENNNPAKLVIFKVEGDIDIKTFEMPRDATMSFDQGIINNGYKIIFSADGGPDVGGNITVNYQSATKFINVSTAGVIKLASSAPTPTPSPISSPTITTSPTPSSGPVTYKDVATYDVYVTGTPPIDVRLFLTVPSSKTSDGVCVNKLISASLNIYEQHPPLDAVSPITLGVFYKYFFDVNETSSAAFINSIPLLQDTTQRFTISDSDNPQWIKIDVTEALRNALDPHMLFAIGPVGTGPYGTVTQKGDSFSSPFSSGFIYAGKYSYVNTLESAGFTSLHNGDSVHHPYVELICNP